MPCDTLSCFPAEIVLDIVSYLGVREIGSLTRSCRRLYNLLNELLYQHSTHDSSIATRPLIWAANRGARGTLHRIFEYTTPRPQELAAALLTASVNNHVAFAKLLVDHGAPTDGNVSAGRDPLESTPLYAAATRGHLHMVHLLLDAGVRPAYCGIETMAILLGRCTRVPAARENRPHKCDRRIMQLIFQRGLCLVRYEGLLSRVLREGYNLCCVAGYLLELGFDPNAQDDRGQTAILLAITRHAKGQGDKAIARFVSKCLKFGARVDTRDHHRETALHAAAVAHLPLTARALLASGADPNACRGGAGSTPLHSTIWSLRDTPQAWEVLRALLDSGADMGVVNEHGWRRLIQSALRRGNRAWLKEILVRGLERISRGRHGTPIDQLLLVAAFLGDVIAVRQLLGSLGSEDGTNISAALRETDSEGHTPLMIAARLGDDDIVRALIPHISQSDACGTRNTSGESVLHLAMYSGKEEIVRILVEWSPDALRAVDCKWRTPLAVAVQIQTVDVVEYLLDKGSNIATRDSGHRTLLHHAVDRGSESIVRLLLERKCPRTRDRSGETAFTSAARKGKPEIIRLFLDHGESTEHRDGDGQTILMNVVPLRSLEVVTVVLEAGTDLEAQSDGRPMKGATGLVIAQKNKPSSFAEFLADSGADCPATARDN